MKHNRNDRARAKIDKVSVSGGREVMPAMAATVRDNVLVVDGKRLGDWLSSDYRRRIKLRPPGTNSAGSVDVTRPVARWNAWLAEHRASNGGLGAFPIQINKLSVHDICLAGIDLSCVTLQEAGWERVDAERCDLRGATLQKSDLRSVSFVGADWRETTSERSRYELCQLRGVRVAATRFRGCLLKTTQLREFTSDVLHYSGIREPIGLQFTATVLDGVRFQDVTLRHALLHGCELSAITVRDSVLEGARLNSLNFGSLRGKPSTTSLLERCELLGCSFSDFSGAERIGYRDVVARACPGLVTALRAPKPGLVLATSGSELRPEVAEPLVF